MFSFFSLSYLRKIISFFYKKQKTNRNKENVGNSGVGIGLPEASFKVYSNPVWKHWKQSTRFAKKKPSDFNSRKLQMMSKSFHYAFWKRYYTRKEFKSKKVWLWSFSAWSLQNLLDRMLNFCTQILHSCSIFFS